MALDIQERLQRLSSSAVADARGKRGALEGAIRRLHGTGTVAGPLITAKCAEGSVSAVLRALADAEPGQVLFVQGTGEWAYSGELTAVEAVRCGIAALVIDGYIRDLERLVTLPLPIFARGLTPQGGSPVGKGEAGVALLVGAAREEVRPGDWIVGDIDGLTVIPAAELEATVDRAEEITRAETACFHDVLGGASLLDQPYQDGTPLRVAMLKET